MGTVRRTVQCSAVRSVGCHLPVGGVLVGIPAAAPNPPRPRCRRRLASLRCRELGVAELDGSVGGAEALGDLLEVAVTVGNVAEELLVGKTA